MCLDFSFSKESGHSRHTGEKSEGHLSTLSLDLHYLNICFMFVSLCVHKHAHIRTSKCVHSHGELKRFRIDFLLTAGKNRDAGERRRKTRGRGQGKERGSESVAFSVLGRGEWAELSGRVCGQPEAVIG